MNPSISLGDIATVKGGKRLPKGSDLTDLPTPHPYIRITDMRDGYVETNQIRYVPIDIQKQIARYTISVDDIFISIVGTIGLVGRIPERLNNANLTENAAKISVTKPEVIDTDFLCYFLRSSFGQEQIKSLTVGSTQPKLAIFRIQEIKIPTIPISTQKKIADTLKSIDQKISINTQISRNLESMAKAIFKEWFIDFGPVKAKAEGKKPFGMDDETAALFPDSFEESELGQIPKGWKICELDSISEILNGFAFKSEDYKSSGVFVLRTKNFSEQGFAEKLNDDVFLSEDKAKEYDSYYVQPFDIHLVMVAASIGKTSITPPSILPALRNQNMWCFRNKTNFPFRHTLNLMIPLVSNDLKGFSSGSARDFFRKGDFQKYKLILPPERLLANAEEVFKSLFEMIALNIAENASLTQTRDLLLPKLVSGQVTLEGF